MVKKKKSAIPKLHITHPDQPPPSLLPSLCGLACSIENIYIRTKQGIQRLRPWLPLLCCSRHISLHPAKGARFDHDDRNALLRPWSSFLLLAQFPLQMGNGLASS